MHFSCLSWQPYLVYNWYVAICNGRKVSRHQFSSHIMCVELPANYRLSFSPNESIKVRKAIWEGNSLVIIWGSMWITFFPSNIKNSAETWKIPKEEYEMSEALFLIGSVLKLIIYFKVYTSLKMGLPFLLPWNLNKRSRWGKALYHIALWKQISDHKDGKCDGVKMILLTCDQYDKTFVSYCLVL